MAIEDLFVLNLKYRSLDFSADHGGGILVVGKIVRRQLGVCHHECSRLACTARTTGTLHIVRRAGRNVTHIDSLQTTNINAHFECC